MKMITLGIVCLFLAGCASTNKDVVYYETVKSMSKDNTMAQTACWATISDIAKNGDSGAKVGAISLAEKCKTETIKIEAPKKNWLGL